MRKTLFSLLALPFLLFTLASCDEYIKGVFEDNLKKAQEGDADSQIIVGTFYHSGVAVEEDLEKSALWFRRAADQGHPTAEYVLGVYYLEGKGVERNPRRAYILMSLARAGGFEDSENVLPGYLDKAKANMSMTEWQSAEDEIAALLRRRGLLP